MTWNGFEAFFLQATGSPPFPYQQRLATHETLPDILHVPTGASKTAAVVLGWLWRRRYHADPQIRRQTPRRLVYCLPMRILVEQTESVVRAHLEALGLNTPAGVRVAVLMGGEADDEWLLHPAADTVLIGTQDMLLSRALNRGYGMSRFRWPHAFGLLHSDCLWVCDEVQLFGAGLSTALQVHAFRRRLGVFGPTQTLWLSATLQPQWLETVDHPAPSEQLRLGAADVAHPKLGARLRAAKTLHPLLIKEGVQDKGYAKAVAGAVKDHHVPGTLTLVLVNTVERARTVYAALRGTIDDAMLIHSRFRPTERAALVSRLTAPLTGTGRVAVCTQVVEAGVDISARTLLTELAPWVSMVQRMGRCNRYGEHEDATVHWIDLADKHGAPYGAAEMQQSRSLLTALTGSSVAPADLPPVTLAPEPGDVIRLRDMVDLFDTAPDLSGNDIDVSRYIREKNDHDLQVFWRSWDSQLAPAKDLAAPGRTELCPVPLSSLRDFLTKQNQSAWIWDHLEDRWAPCLPRSLRPGQIILLRSEAGGYSLDTGWDPSAKGVVPATPHLDSQKAEGTGDDQRSFAHWQTVARHTDQVVATLELLLEGLTTIGLPARVIDSLRRGARWHDAGKAHPIFQATMLANFSPEERATRAAQVWAKTERGARRHSRPHFRHEVASALALLQSSTAGASGPDSLAAYLVAAHHGRARLALRSLPGEKHPESQIGRFALGIWDGDTLPTTDLGGGVELPATTLGLGLMELGGGPNGETSWTDRALSQRDDPELGLFRLAYLEALLRAADAYASASGREEGP